MKDDEVDEVWLKKLQDEVGDVSCMVDILFMTGLVSRDQIDGRKKVKKRKLCKWSTIFEK